MCSSWFESRLTVFIFIISTILCPSVHLQNLNQNSAADERLSPCAACRLLSKEFIAALEKTQRNKYEGGDAAYEEKRGLRYENSEVRLIEAEDFMCVDVKKYGNQCRDLKEEHEALLEEWYNSLRIQDPHSLEKWLCIEKLNICCDKGYFGAQCSPCTGGADKPCSGHGKCRGSGTRKGNGTCICQIGYRGDLCDQCLDGFFFNSKTSTCDPCDKSCETCRESTAKGCVVCADGYSHTEEWGCSDKDECVLSGENPCEDNTFCVNFEGGFDCLACDKTCDGCYGDGPDSCVKCARGYAMNKEVCTQLKSPNLQMTMARWAVYLGLVICTVIISKKSILLCSFIGLFVALYIGASEYTTGEWEDFDFSKLLRSLAE